MADPTRPCGYCGRVRRKYELGSSKRSRAQHPTIYVCGKGHQLYRKRGQAG